MAEIRFAHVGLGDCVCVNHILAIIQSGSTTARRYQANARHIKKYVDACHGKAIKSFLLLDDGTVVASHIKPLTLMQRLTFPRTTTSTGVERTPPETPYIEPSNADFVNNDEDDADIEEESEEMAEGLDDYEEEDEDEDVSE